MRERIDSRHRIRVDATRQSAKAVLLEIGRRAVELKNNGASDAAADAGEGMAEVAAAIRSVASG